MYKIPTLPASLQLPSIYGSVLSYEEILNIVVCKINEIVNFMDGELTKDLQAYIDARFNEIMVKAIYNADTETIIFDIPEVNK